MPCSLSRLGVIDQKQSGVLLEMAGYRNRLVRFYDEVSAAELYEVCTQRIADMSGVRDAMLQWLREHPDKVDGTF